MTRAKFMDDLAELISPRSPERARNLLASMLPYLDDLPDEDFCEESLRALASKLKRSPNYAQVRAEITEWHRASTLPAPSNVVAFPRVSDADRLEEDAVSYAREWDDPPGILHAIRKCEGHMASLRYLGFVIAHHAPQHLSLLPPHVIDLLVREGTPHMRRLFASQFADLGARPNNDLDHVEERAPPSAHYLTPEQLDAINPLPGGRKRAAPPEATP